MQVSSAVPVNLSFSSCSASSVSKIAEVAGKIEHEFRFKLNVNEETFDGLEDLKNQKLQEEEEEEFSFVCTNPDGSPISADDIFQNGQIRPVYPLFSNDSETKSFSELGLRPPLKKLFVEERDHASSAEAEEPEGPHCAWTGKAVEASQEACKKSNSTGFSKLRRFRELVLRSNSDGKDAFVFLHHDHHSNPSTITTATTRKKTNQAEKSEKVTEKKQTPAAKKGKNSEKPSTSAHERLYIKNRAIKEEHKRKSYLPYRVGFFTSVNGFSKNVHPY